MNKTLRYLKSSTHTSGGGQAIFFQSRSMTLKLKVLILAPAASTFTLQTAAACAEGLPTKGPTRQHHPPKAEMKSNGAQTGGPPPQPLPVSARSNPRSGWGLGNTSPSDVMVLDIIWFLQHSLNHPLYGPSPKTCLPWDTVPGSE